MGLNVCSFRRARDDHKALFGANIFYADVSLLWEAWLGNETDRPSEIVVNKHLKENTGGKSIAQYQALMTRAFAEVRRVLKPSGHAVLIFSNISEALASVLVRSAVT